MQLYPGIAPLTVNPSGSGSPGIVVTSGASDTHGWWPSPLVVQGNDPRSAANLNAAVEAAIDRINWIGWRVIDWIAGGSYTWTNPVTLLNQLFLNGGVAISDSYFRIRTNAAIKSYIGNGSTFHVGDPGGLDGNGTLDFVLGANTLSGAISQTASVQYSAGAWRANRKITVSATVAGFVAQNYDTVWCYNLTLSNYTLAMSDPNVAGPGSTPLPEGIRCTFCIPRVVAQQTLNTSTVTILDHNSHSLGILTTSTLSQIIVETVYNGAAVVWDTVG